MRIKWTEVWIMAHVTIDIRGGLGCEIFVILGVMRSYLSERALTALVDALVHVYKCFCQMGTDGTQTVYSFFHSELFEPIKT